MRIERSRHGTGAGCIMHSIKGRRALLLGGLAAATSRQTARARPLRVLFIGNSFTIGHNVPALVDSVAQDAGLTWQTKMIARPGMTLTRHIAETQFFELLHTQKPDMLVVQDHSTEPLTVEGRQRSANALSKIRSVSPVPMILFATWPRHHAHPFYAKWSHVNMTPRQMMEIVEAHYQFEARRLGAMVAPVGRAWMDAADIGLHLFADDGYHASASGALLTSLVLARTLGIPLGTVRTIHRDVPLPLAQHLLKIAAQLTL